MSQSQPKKHDWLLQVLLFIYLVGYLIVDTNCYLIYYLPFLLKLYKLKKAFNYRDNQKNSKKNYSKKTSNKYEQSRRIAIIMMPYWKIFLQNLNILGSTLKTTQQFQVENKKKKWVFVTTTKIKSKTISYVLSDWSVHGLRHSHDHCTFF